MAKGSMPPTGAEIVQQVRRETGPKTLLAFSAGKDSIAAALAIRDVFEEVIPIYFYAVPDLEFVEDALTFYEKTLFRGRHIMRIPHPSLYRLLNAMVFQPPHRAPVIEAAELPEFSFKEAHDMVRAQCDAKDALCATGIRSADSPMRLVSIKQHGAILRSKGEYFPVWDWRKDDLIKCFAANKVQLSPEYAVFGRSWDGVDARFLIPMKKHYPRDYARVLELFPLAEAEVFRFERMAK